MGKSHPTIYHIIKEFQKEEGDTAVMMLELEQGKKIRQPQRLKYRRINERLQTLALSYDRYKEEGTRPAFMRACGHNVAL